MSSQQPCGGRIRPHEQDTGDGNVEIPRANIEVPAKHITSVKATKREDLTERNRRECRNRIKHIYEWLQTEYPKYYNIGGTELSSSIGG